MATVEHRPVALDGAGLRLRIPAGRTVARLGAIAALLLVGGFLAEVARVGFGHGRLHGLVPLLDLDGEANLPAAYSAALLALCGATLWLIAAWRRQVAAPHVRPLRFLSVLLVVMAVDEASQIHVEVSAPVRSALELDGFLYYSWVVVYGALALALAVAFLPLIGRLGRGTRAMVLAAAALYVGGALGLELAGSAVADGGGRGEWPYALLTTVEEGMEFAGVLLLLYALLASLRAGCGQVSARLVSAGWPHRASGCRGATVARRPRTGSWSSETGTGRGDVMPPRDDDAPRITEDDRRVMEHPEEGFDPDAPAEEIDREIAEQAEVSERDAEWIDPEERVGGD